MSWRRPTPKIGLGWGRHRSKTAVALVGSVLLVSLVGGCGAEEGVAEDAVVTVYSAQESCEEAQQVLEDAGEEAGGVRVQVRCLSSTERAGRFDLAQVGANARRATQDSSAVGYIGEPAARATRFSEPILDAAGIAQLPGMSGGAAMRRLLDAIAAAPEDGGLRESVYEQLG